MGGLGARYEAEIFPPIVAFGIARSELQLAWDFTTRSEASVTRDLLAIREDIMKAFGGGGAPVVAVTKVTQDPSPEIARRIEGTLEVPMFLEGADTLSTLRRDASGRPRAQGVIKVPFLVQIPSSVLPTKAGDAPARVLQYGHGFFGSREEINYSFMKPYSQKYRFVTAAVDWQGMSQDDLGNVIGAISNSPQDTFLFANSLHQAMANAMTLTYALGSSLANLPELNEGGATLYDPTHVYYYGISQGHIFGVPLVALSPQIERAVMNVGGAPYSFMMSRSENFGAFLLIIRILLRRKSLDVQKFVTLSQHGFDRVDPATWAPYLTKKSALPGAPKDRVVLSQFGYWDHSVPTLSGLNLARMMSLPLLEPTPKKPYGFDTVASPTMESAALLLDYKVGQPIPGYVSKPATTDSPVHNSIRQNPAVQSQIDAFLRPQGVIQNFCEGACDPE